VARNFELGNGRLFSPEKWGIICPLANYQVFERYSYIDLVQWVTDLHPLNCTLRGVFSSITFHLYRSSLLSALDVIIWTYCNLFPN
jgi:hypothetical protein